MEKIKALLQKAEVSPELASKICESLEKYKSSVAESEKAQYNKKLEEAKKVCVEETEAYKRELARRLQTFCETKGASIEAALAKQSALRNSEALATLTSVRDLLEGIEPSGAQNGATTATIEKAKRKILAVTEEKNRAVKASNRSSAIAEKTLKRNRQLEAELRSLKSQLSEASQITEGRQRVKGQGGQRRGQPRRLDSQRRGGKPQSTRPTLLESQDRRPAQRKPQNTGAPQTIDDIANMMDGDLV